MYKLDGLTYINWSRIINCKSKLYAYNVDEKVIYIDIWMYYVCVLYIFKM